jgi:hypothetical protein
MEHNAINYVLQKKQRELDMQMGILDQKRMTANEYYGIKSMDSHVGPLTMRLRFLREQPCIYRYTMVEQSELAKEIGPTKYFLKLINPEHHWMTCYFNKSMPLNQTQNYVYGIGEKDLTLFPCINSLFLMKGSIIEKYLI